MEHHQTEDQPLLPKPAKVSVRLTKVSPIIELVEFVITDTTNEYREINLGKIHNYKAQEIAAATGVVVRYADKKITSHGVRHALIGHNDHQNENARGQLGLKPEHFDRIPEVLNNPDRYEKGNKKNTVMFVKAIKECVYHVIMGMVKNKEGGHDLVLHTMFLKKKGN